MCGDSAARTGLFLLLIHFAFTVIVTAWQGGTPWATPDEEAMDEVNDAQILRAVRQSVSALHKRMSRYSHRHKRAEKSVCYDGVGCFRDSYGYIDMLPSPPEEIATRFLLYNSRKNRRGDTPLLDVAFTNLTAVFHWAGQAFNVSAPTKVIVHGFGSSCSHVWVYEMRSALMSVENCNIICVDWEGGATLPNYVRASANARLVGKQVAMLISGLNEKLGLPLNNVHLIGFSLGAHVAGFAGAELKNLSRITGLDPAGPLFESQDPRARLDSSDAHFVDVIHSNGENLILGGLGSWQPMGHVDFYPNGGRMQKGCSNLFVGAVTDIFLSVSEVEGRSLCNHRRAYKFFTDSVSPRCQFPSVSCETFDKYAAGMCFPCAEYGLCGNMGYYADKSKGRGTQFLVTREEEPFCANQYLVKVDSTKSVLPMISYGKIQLTLISDLDLNETFTLTLKDDEELKVGASLSKIIVPHPAIQEFTTVQILYTAYSGWISSGLAKWHIDRIVLTDAYSKSLSVCRKGLVLESGIPTVLPLFPGECHTPSKGSQEPLNKKNISVAINSTGIISFYNVTNYKPTQVVKIGDEILNASITEKKDVNITHEDITSHYLNAPWQPVLEYPEVSGNTGNGIEPLSEDSGRGFITVREIPKEKNSSIAGNNKTVSTNTSKDTLVLGELVMVREFNSSAGNSSSNKIDDPDERMKMELSGELLPKEKNKNKDEPPYEFVKVNNENTSFENVSSTSRPEIKEPILPGTTQRVRTSSKFENNKWVPRTDLNPPSMGATESWLHWESISGRKVKNLDLDKNENKNETERSFSLFTVQLLPQRLVSFLEQAERYARMAFSPFVSSDPETRGQRRLKFLPQFWYSDNTKRSNPDTNKKITSFELDKDSTNDNTRIVIPFSDEKTSYKPKFIPLKPIADQSTPVPKAEKNFNRPDMIVEHMEEPMIEDMVVKDEDVIKDRNTR